MTAEDQQRWTGSPAGGFRVVRVGLRLTVDVVALVTLLVGPGANDVEGAGELDSVGDIDEASKNEAMDVAADEGTKGGADNDDGCADDEEPAARCIDSQGFGMWVGSLPSEALEAFHAPFGVAHGNDGVYGHEDDGGGRGRLLRDAEEEREHGEGADVDA